MRKHYRNSGKMIGAAFNPLGIVPAPLPKPSSKPLYSMQQMRGAIACTIRAMRKEGCSPAEVLEYRNRFPGLDRLFHVCAALDKDLTSHTNTQDAHNL